MIVEQDFPNCDINGWFSVPSYDEVVAKLGKIEIEAHDDDYQGDSYFLLSKGDKIGYLSFSWGSCSGCDALQACENYQDLQNLIDRLETSIIWCNSLKEMQDWVANRDWEATAEWHLGAKKFLKQFREYHLRAFK